MTDKVIVSTQEKNYGCEKIKNNVGDLAVNNEKWRGVNSVLKFIYRYIKCFICI